MARKMLRKNPGDVANTFIRCLLADAGEILGGITDEQWSSTFEYFEFRCPYTGVAITDESAVKDHAIPLNKDHCGLHLYGNVLLCTDEANRQKHRHHYRDFVTDRNRLEKIESFLEHTGYWDKAKTLGNLQAYCQTQYEVITGFCQRNKDYLRRITGQISDDSNVLDATEQIAVGTHSDRDDVLPISLEPASEAVFKEALLRTKRAWILPNKPWLSINSMPMLIFSMRPTLVILPSFEGFWSRPSSFQKLLGMLNNPSN